MAKAAGSNTSRGSYAPYVDRSLDILAADPCFLNFGCTVNPSSRGGVFGRGERCLAECSGVDPAFMLKLLLLYARELPSPYGDPDLMPGSIPVPRLSRRSDFGGGNRAEDSWSMAGLPVRVDIRCGDCCLPESGGGTTLIMGLPVPLEPLGDVRPFEGRNDWGMVKFCECRLGLCAFGAELTIDLLQLPCGSH